MVKIKLRDDIKEFENGITPADVCKEISMGLYRNLCACLINGQSADIRTPINEDCELELLTFDSEEGKHAFWHTASHILAQAVKRLYPEAKLAIGPAIDNGFYYDIDSEISFTPEILTKIEAEMKKIVKEDITLERFTMPRDEAIKYFEQKGEDYKVELISDLPEGEEISFYSQGDFTDF